MSYTPFNFTEVIEYKIQAIFWRDEIRSEILANCKTQRERERYEDKWAADDRAEKIADAIESVARAQRSRGLFGLF